MPDDRTIPADDVGPTEKDHGARMTGRSFAGTSWASDQQEQTGDHRAAQQAHRLDDGGARVNENEDRPADES